ncbi:hypothetical protein [Aerobium aerolatum]|uniref:Uncharacterized protein n=1 Tax=Aquamicrobium aerolatum DSM 21857 TaxID=1121003 RepID=A0A1I3JKR4_9HYPH|nr:hypothetical protein [Aquamicrobium aerolatum]SFI60588.1 hypothetical protein SAMN03080618_00887 [Aquamicrobium aerolatum DSM 21857]
MTATILPFVVRSAREGARPGSGPPAQIVIFPGVRYEAYPDDDEPKAASAEKGRRPRRKVR